jgi:hypothetical protein
MTAKRITERVSAPFVSATVNRDAGTITGVLICGTASANGRDYPVSVFRRDFAKYESRPVNCDHGREATVERRFGWFSDVVPGTDGRPRGTLNCLKSHPMYERVMEAAERNPALFGFSHVAICRTKPGPGGREVVEAIESVESIDLVAEPASTKSLFEGHPVSLTIKQLAEALIKHPKVSSRGVRPLKWLAEMDGMDTVPTTVGVPPADDTDPGSALDQAFIDAAVAEMKECMDAKGDPAKLKKCLGKLKKMLQAHAEIVAGDEGDDTDDGHGDADQEADDATGEGKAVTGGAITEALAVCESIQFRPDAADLKLIAGVAKGDRPALAAKLKKVADGSPGGSGSEKPTSAGRGRIAETVSGTTGSAPTTEAKPPTEGKAFAEYIRESQN